MSDEPELPIDEWEEYETGPFCRHWADPNDCDELCKTCGHKCDEHNFDSYDAYCLIDTCNCKSWNEGI